MSLRLRITAAADGSRNFTRKKSGTKNREHETSGIDEQRKAHSRVERGRSPVASRGARRDHQQSGRHGAGGTGRQRAGSACGVSKTPARRDSDGPEASGQKRNRRDGQRVGGIPGSTR